MLRDLRFMKKEGAMKKNLQTLSGILYNSILMLLMNLQLHITKFILKTRFSRIKMD